MKLGKKMSDEVLVDAVF